MLAPFDLYDLIYTMRLVFNFGNSCVFGNLLADWLWPVRGWVARHTNERQAGGRRWGHSEFFERSAPKSGPPPQLRAKATRIGDPGAARQPTAVRKERFINIL